MEIQKLFATVGWTIDDTNLIKFQERVEQTVTVLTTLSDTIKTVSADMTLMTAKFSTLKSGFDLGFLSQVRTKLDNINRVDTKGIGGVGTNNTTMRPMISNMERLTENVWALDIALTEGSGKWLEYAASITTASEALTGILEKQAALRLRAPTSVGVRGGGLGAEERAESTGMMSQLGGFLTGFLPKAVTTIANPLTLGLGGAMITTDLIKTGMEMKSLDIALKSVSDSTEQYNENLKYVQETTARLGVPIKEFQSAFLNIFAAAKEHMTPQQIKEMMSGVAENLEVKGVRTEDQSLFFQAMKKSIDAQKLTAAHLNQMAMRVPNVVQQMAIGLGVSVKELMKLQHTGKLDVNKAFLGMAKEMHKAAAPLLPEATATALSRGNALKSEYKKFAEDFESAIDKPLANFFILLTEALKALKIVAVPTLHVIGDISSGMGKLIKTGNDLAKSIFEGIKESKLFIIASIGVIASLLAIQAGFAGTAAAATIFGIRAVESIMAVGRALSAMGIPLLVIAAAEFAQSIDDFNKGIQGTEAELMFSRLNRLAESFDYKLSSIRLHWLEMWNPEAAANLNFNKTFEKIDAEARRVHKAIDAPPDTPPSYFKRPIESDIYHADMGKNLNLHVKVENGKVVGVTSDTNVITSLAFTGAGNF